MTNGISGRAVRINGVDCQTSNHKYFYPLTEAATSSLTSKGVGTIKVGLGHEKNPVVSLAHVDHNYDILAIH